MQSFQKDTDKFIMKKYRIPFIFKNKPLLKSCIYRIWFGDCYYIGSTKNIYNRVNGHQSELDKQLTKKNISSGTYRKIVCHILNTIGISCAVVEIIRPCPEEDLHKTERECHLKVLDDPQCLNVFNHHRTTLKIIEWQKKHVV